MLVKSTTSHLSFSLAVCSSIMGQKVKGPEYDSPNGGPPASFFAASSSLPVAGLEAAAAHASVVPEYANYPIDHGSSVISTIHSDWAKFTSVNSA